MARSAIALLSRPRQAGSGSACLARRSAIGARSIGRIRLGSTRRGIPRRVRVGPVSRTRDTYRYCTTGGSGPVTAVFSNRGRGGRVELVVTTALGHGNRNVRVRSGGAAFERAYPNRRRVAPGLYRATPHSARLFGVRRGGVRFVAVASARLLRNPRRLLRDLRLARR